MVIMFIRFPNAYSMFFDTFDSQDTIHNVLLFMHNITKVHSWHSRFLRDVRYVDSKSYKYSFLSQQG